MLQVRGIGLVSSLGLDATTSLAAARAGLSRCAQLRTVNAESDEATAGGAVFGHSVPCGVSNGFAGLAKALLLGKAALADLLSSWSAPSPARVGVYVILSDYFLIDGTQPPEEELDEARPLPGAGWRSATADFIAQLIADGPLAPASHRRLFYGGHAEVAGALTQADLDLSAGTVDACVIGAVDCCIEPRAIRAAARARVLKTEATSTGFLPGEAAAFAAVTADGAGPEGRVLVRACALTTDPKHGLSDQPADGAGLAEAVSRCLERLTADEQVRIGLVIGDLNGEERRALEWGGCLVRLQSRYGLGRLPTWQPAASFGETGCAAGVLLMCVGVRALQRHYAGTQSILIVLSSEGPGKAAVCLTN